MSKEPNIPNTNYPKFKNYKIPDLSEIVKNRIIDISLRDILYIYSHTLILQCFNKVYLLNSMFSLELLFVRKLTLDNTVASKHFLSTIISGNIVES